MKTNSFSLLDKVCTSHLTLKISGPKSFTTAKNALLPSSFGIEACINNP